VKFVPETLARALERSLAPAYLVMGDEPLVIAECADLIRARAKAAGFALREVHFAGPGFDWNGFGGSLASLSLFAERRVQELRLPTGKPGAEGARALAELAKAPSGDNLLLVLCDAVEWAERGAAWVKAFESAAALVEVDRLRPEQLPSWVRARLEALGLAPEREAVELIAERCEGNLLAAHQVMRRLALEVGAGPLSAQVVEASIGNNARYDIWKLGEAILEGDAKRSLRILNGLEQEGEEATLVLWAISEELRSLLQWRGDAAGGGPKRLWRGGRLRQALLARAAKRIPRARLVELLVGAQRTDLVLKGSRPGEPWDALARLALAAAGAPLKVAS
jgi:DNA polymerase III subunit delta